MKTIISATTILICLFCCVHCNSHPIAVTKAEILQEFGSIFKTTTTSSNGRTYTYETIAKLPDNHYLAALTNQHSIYLDYLTANYTQLDYKKPGSLSGDTIARNAFYIQSLQSDTLFLHYFWEMMYYYLSSRKIKLTDYAPPPKLTISPEKLTAIASRFFYAAGPKNDSAFIWKICVGDNGWRDCPKNTRAPLAEAFCLMVIFDNMGNSRHDYYADFDKNITLIEEKTKNRENKLTVAREQMYAAMQQSKALKKILLKKYHEHKSMINFEVKE